MFWENVLNLVIFPLIPVSRKENSAHFLENAVAHILEEAKSGRSKCRGCGNAIAKGELRFGECLPNPFADGDMTLWFHIRCGALRRPESFSEMLDDDALKDIEELSQLVEEGKAHHRLERIAGAQKAPSGRARCRSCREMIAKDEWRVPLEFFEEGMFNSSGFVHVTCAEEFFGTKEILPRLNHFNPDLNAAELEELTALLS